MSHHLSVAYLSTYPPRECGIANFTKDLVDAIHRTRLIYPPRIVAVNEPAASYNYNERVIFQIEEDEINTYVQAANYVNKKGIDLLNIQHEFGLFGGAFGEFIIALLKENKKPVVTTLHTVLSQPSLKMRDILNEISYHSDVLVVMTKRAREILKDKYKIECRIEVIFHGCPDIPLISSEKAKANFGYKNRVILTTFGLLSPNKGIEYAIKALPNIVEVEPRSLYIILGVTHPGIRKRSGERYRNRLMKLVEKLGLRRHVRFHNRYLSRREIVKYLQATDIYLSPHTVMDQIVSGTLTYALGAGKAIISTPYLYAQEVLSNERGLLCKFKSPTSISDCVIRLLKDTDLRKKFERKAYSYSREMPWQKVGVRYIELFKETLEEGKHH